MLKNYKFSIITIILSLTLCALYFIPMFILNISILNNSTSLDLSLFNITFRKSINIFNKTQEFKGNIILLSALFVPLVIIFIELIQGFIVNSKKIITYIIIGLSSINIIQFLLFKLSFNNLVNKFLISNTTSNPLMESFIKNNLSINISCNYLFYLIFVINLLIIITCIFDTKDKQPY